MSSNQEAQTEQEQQAKQQKEQTDQEPEEQADSPEGMKVETTTEERVETAPEEVEPEGVEGEFEKFLRTYAWNFDGKRLRLIPQVSNGDDDGGTIRWIVRIYKDGVIGALEIDERLEPEVADEFNVPSEIIDEVVNVQRRLESEFDRIPTSEQSRLVDQLLGE